MLVNTSNQVLGGGAKIYQQKGKVARSCPTSCTSWTGSLPDLCPWNSLDKNTGVGSSSLLQGIIPTQDRTQDSHIAGGFFIRPEPLGSLCKGSLSLTGPETFEHRHGHTGSQSSVQGEKGPEHVHLWGSLSGVLC